jgi:cytochrome c biogenesis protein CcdA
MESNERSQMERDIRAKVVRRARARLGFRWHLTVFVLVNLALYALDMSFTPNVRWFLWPLGGWGIALGLHAFAVFQGPAIDEAALEAEVQRELSRTLQARGQAREPSTATRA